MFLTELVGIIETEDDNLQVYLNPESDSLIAKSTSAIKIVEL